MRINNNIWFQSISCKWHITFWNNITNCSFLSVTRTKFITNYRLSNGACFYLRKIISFPISIYKILINICVFICFTHFTLVFIFNQFRMVVFIFFYRNYFGNNDIPIFNKSVFWYKTTTIQFIIVRHFHPLCL